MIVTDRKAGDCHQLRVVVGIQIIHVSIVSAKVLKMTLHEMDILASSIAQSNMRTK